MKNRLLIYILPLFFTGFWSCKSDESVFPKTADERLNEALTNYQTELSGAEFGWKGVIYPGAGGSYGFYFKFNDQNRVVMYSDFDKESAVTAKESSYRLKALQSPSLIFDTYSYLHVLADPDAGINGGSYGEGLQSDFEFSFGTDSLNTGTITLIGTKNRTRLVLTKATQEEAVAYGNGGLGKSLLFSNINNYLNYFKRITIGGVTYEINVNTDSRSITFVWLEGTTRKTFATDYSYGSTGITLLDPLVNGSQTIASFSSIVWDEARLSLSFSAGSTNITAVGFEKPLAIDVAAARAWWNDPIPTGGDWRSVEGFHINGVDDAFGLKDMTAGTAPYIVLVFQPGLTSTYDLFGPAFFVNNGLSLEYWYASQRPNFTSDGRAIFSLYGTAGTPPTSGPIINTKNLLFDTSGFYFVRTSATTYDMVSAKDGKSWISWF